MSAILAYMAFPGIFVILDEIFSFVLISIRLDCLLINDLQLANDFQNATKDFKITALESTRTCTSCKIAFGHVHLNVNPVIYFFNTPCNNIRPAFHAKRSLSLTT